jgi:hypothetical protein
VPREAAVIGKNDVITKLAVVRDVRIAEKQIVRADPSRQLLMGTAMYRAVRLISQTARFPPAPHGCGARNHRQA